MGTDAERSQRKPGTLDRSATLIESALRDAGYPVTRLAYSSDAASVVNVEAALAGGAKAREIVVIGAHYDTAAGAPGADDNASGVAAMLAIARALAAEKHAPARTVRFVGFVNEEPPYFWNAEMGSLVYAKACKARGDDVVAMLSLETLGYYREGAGTQKYPPIVSWFYPDRADFVAFVGNLGSRSVVHDAIRTFRSAAAFPSEGAALPSFVAGVGWSDQWSFWQVGYPGGDGHGHRALPQSQLPPAERHAGDPRLPATRASDRGARGGGEEARRVAQAFLPFLRARTMNASARPVRPISARPLSLVFAPEVVQPPSSDEEGGVGGRAAVGALGGGAVRAGGAAGPAGPAGARRAAAAGGTARAARSGRAAAARVGAAVGVVEEELTAESRRPRSGRSAR